MRTILMLIMVLLFQVTSVAEVINIGRYQIDVDPSGIKEIRCDRIPILRAPYISIFKPGWKGVFLVSSSGTFTQSRQAGVQVFTWASESPEAGRIQIELKVGEKLEMTFTTDVKVSGHYEAGYYLPVEEKKIPLRAFYHTLEGGYLCVEAGKKMLGLPQYIGLVEAQIGELLVRYRSNESCPFQVQDYRSGKQNNLRILRATTIEKQLKERIHLTIEVDTVGTEPGQVPGIRKAKSDLTNGSFEEGDKDWNCPPWFPKNAVIDEKEACDGHKSLRIEVKKGDSTDVTRYFPVEPGKTYSFEACIKTRDLKDGAASLTLEWADANKDWLQTGGYPPGVSGTSDWQKVFCVPSPTVTAPKGARYAIIFLICRGIGTAWFDDIRVTSYVSPPVELVDPKIGAVIENNRPTFRWNRLHAISPYVLEISTSPTFASKDTLRFAVDNDEYTPSEPLVSGKHYWRVRIKASDRFSGVGMFEQTASPKDDTTGPSLNPMSQYMPDKGSVLVVNAKDASGVDIDSIRCRVDGISAKVKVEGEKIEIVPAAEWKRLNWVELTVKDKPGNQTNVRFPVTHCPPQPKVHFRKDSVMMVDDKPVFPIGIYQVVKADMPAAKRVGFDLVHDYTWEDSQDDAAVRDYLDEAQKNGLKCFIGFDRGKEDRPGLCRKNFDMVAKRVAALMDHPALYAWYLIDEPEGKMMHPFLVRQYRDLINRLDPFHPTTAVVGMNDTSAYTGTIDWHWSESYCGTAHIAVDFDGRGAGLKGTPQCALNRTIGEPKKSDGTVNPPEYFYRLFRPGAYMGIVHGSNGLCYWWWTWQPEEMANPEKQRGMAKLIRELRFMEPILVAEGPVRHPMVTPKTVHTWSKDVNGRRTVIAVNPTGAPVEAKINVGISRRVKVLFEDREIVAEKGTITDRFEADSAHVYEVPLEAARK